MISASLVGILVIVVSAAGLPPDTPLTEVMARQRAELILRKYLAETKMNRSELAEPFIELHDGDALVSYRLRNNVHEGIVITLGKDGSEGVSPNIPSKDFP